MSNETVKARVRAWCFDGYGLRGRAFLALFVTGTLLLIVVFAAGGFMLDRNSCHATGRAVHRDVRWSVMAGCIIRTSDGWIPLDNWRGNAG